MIKIMFGNVSINDLEKRCGWNFSKEDKAFLKSKRTDNADVDSASGKFHIFDYPFQIIASEKIYDKLNEILYKYEKKSPSKEGLVLIEKKELED